jgi:beta-lactamase superfamily II metal-dependent hydrolase
MLRIEMLPAHHGDALLIEYGTAKKPFRVLIDGGTRRSLDAVKRRLGEIGTPVALELMVVTHVDDDHIGGALALLTSKPKLIAPKDVWFNAFKHLFPPDRLGPAQGEGLSTAIQRAKLPWNGAFENGSVVVPDAGALPKIKLGGDATITLLSPSWSKLEKMRKTWKDACKAAHLVPGKGAEPTDVLGKRPPPKRLDVEALVKDKFTQDAAPANGTSIGFLFEHQKKRLLLTGDAHPAVLADSLDRLGGKQRLDAWKISHHGSRANSSPSLLDRVDCSRFLISTNSDTFGHPDPEAIARIVARPGKKTIYFNYDTPYTRPWSDVTLRQNHKYAAVYGDVVEGWLAIDL